MFTAIGCWPLSNDILKLLHNIQKPQYFFPNFFFPFVAFLYHKRLIADSHWDFQQAYSESGDIPQGGAYQSRRIPRLDMELLLIAKKKLHHLNRKLLPLH